MIIKFAARNAEYVCDLSLGREISIPFNFDGPQPNAFTAPRAHSSALRVGTFVGDVREGGSCNCDEYHVVAHCNGTHTECVGHITAERISVAERLRELLIPCTLITVRPVDVADTRETYMSALQKSDRLITSGAIKHELQGASPDFLKGLVIRTLPNSNRKLELDYSNETFPFFSNDAMNLIRSLGVDHLLVDMPSIDRASDEGRLSNHRIFWEVEPRSVADPAHSARTITEMIFVPEEIADGRYLAAIQIPHFMADAAPSRVILFPLKGSGLDL